MAKELTNNMQTAMNFAFAIMDYYANKGNQNSLIQVMHMYRANAEYRNTGDIKELDIYKKHISAIRNICDAALKDWEDVRKHRQNGIPSRPLSIRKRDGSY